MHLRADEEKARLVRAVLLDGKAVPMAYEADEEEGWVKSWYPHLPDRIAGNGEKLIKDEVQRAGFDLIKRSGKVRIVFHEPTTVDDSATP